MKRVPARREDHGGTARRERTRPGRERPGAAFPAGLPAALADAIDGFIGYLELERGLSRHTIAAYECDLRQCARFLARRGERGWTAVTPASLTDWIYSLSEDEFAVSSLARKTWSDSLQWIFGKGKFFDDFPAEQVFLNDALQHFRRAGVIPDAFGINDRDGPAYTDTQAVGLGAINQRLRAGEIQFLEPPFQKFPRGQTGLARTAFRLGRVGAKKNVAPEFFNPERFNGG